MYRINEYLEKLIIDYLIKKSLVENGEYKGEKRRKLEERIIEHKREYRKSLKTNNVFYYRGRSCYRGRGKIVGGGGSYDSAWQKVFFSGEKWTEEEKREFINDNWIVAPSSQYDCTGEVFTHGIEVFNVPNGVVVYLLYGIDV